MGTLKKLFYFVLKLPLPGKVLSTFVIALVAIIIIFFGGCASHLSFEKFNFSTNTLNEVE